MFLRSARAQPPADLGEVAIVGERALAMPQSGLRSCVQAKTFPSIRRPRIIFNKHNDHRNNSFGNSLRAVLGRDSREPIRGGQAEPVAVLPGIGYHRRGYMIIKARAAPRHWPSA